MERIIQSVNQNIWYLSKEKSGFVLRLLLQTEPVNRAACVEAELDDKGNPHLIIKNEQQYKYLYWTGSKWKVKDMHITHIPLFFCININTECETNIVYVSKEGSLYHQKLINNNWCENVLDFINGKVTWAALFTCKEQQLALLFSYGFYADKRLVLAFYRSSKWDTVKEISIGKADPINWFINDSMLFVLLGEESLEMEVHEIIRIDLNETDKIIRRRLINQARWEGTPYFIANNDKDLKIYWQCKGNIFMSNIDQISLNEIQTVASSLFYPAELIPIIGGKKATNIIAFRKINGIYLSNPLFLNEKEFARTLKS